MLLDRHPQLARLRHDLDFFPAVGLVGARQVGKTTLARTLAGEAEDALYIDLQLPSAQRQLTDPERFLRAQAGRLVILDEVQTMPEIFPVLRGLIDEDRRAGRFLLLGSAAPALLRSTAESLAGRIVYHELSPFALGELPAGADLDVHWLRGGYPEAYLLDDDQRRLAYFRAYVQAFVATDLRDLAGGTDSAGMARTLQMLAHAHGNLLQASTLARSLAVASVTVARYLDILESAFLLRRLRPYLPNLRKRLTKSPKVYLRDSGLVHGLLGIPDLLTLLAHPIAGASWEGYVIEQVLGQAPDGTQAYHYRSAKGEELDLVLQLPGGEIWALEVKRSNAPTLSKALWTAIGDVQPARTLVVTPDAPTYPVGERVEVMGLRAALGELGGRG